MSTRNIVIIIILLVIVVIGFMVLRKNPEVENNTATVENSLPVDGSIDGGGSTVNSDEVEFDVVGK